MTIGVQIRLCRFKEQVSLREFQGSGSMLPKRAQDLLMILDCPGCARRDLWGIAEETDNSPWRKLSGQEVPHSYREMPIKYGFPHATLFYFGED